MEVWVGIEPTQYGFADRPLNHSSTTPWNYETCCYYRHDFEKIKLEQEKSLFFIET